MKSVPQHSTGIVGYGRFGRALCALVTEAGLDVCAWDAHARVPAPLAAASEAELSARSRVIILAVPIPAFADALDRIAPHLGPDHLVLDVGSVKLGPASLLEERLGERIPWVATHPLFGPASLARGERPLRVVLCPDDRRPQWARRAESFYRTIGCEVIEQPAEEHDRAMANSHALAFFLSKALIDMGAGEGARYTPPSFEAILQTIEAVRADASHLFSAIQNENPFAADARRTLITALEAIDRDLLHAPAADDADGAALQIEGLGASAPDELSPGALLDELDREIVHLLGRRQTLLSRSHGSAGAREPSKLDAWAREEGIAPEVVRALFEALATLPRVSE